MVNYKVYLSNPGLDAFLMQPQLLQKAVASFMELAVTQPLVSLQAIEAAMNERHGQAVASTRPQFCWAALTLAFTLYPTLHVQVRRQLHAWLEYSGHPRISHLLAYWVAQLCQRYATDLQDHILPPALKALYAKKLWPALRILACQQPSLEGLVALEGLLTDAQAGSDEDLQTSKDQDTQVWHMLLDFPAWLQYALHLLFCPSGALDATNPGEKKPEQEKKKKWEPPAPPPRVGRKQKRRDAASGLGSKLPTVTPNAKCKLRLLKLERIKDWLLMEEEFVQNQERLKPQEERNQEDRSKVDDLRGSPMNVGSLEEIIDENHAIISSSVGPEYYVNILSFVDKTQLEPGCSILLHNKVLSIVGILQDETDPMVSVMKVDKAPLESYADVGGLEQQIQEIKEAVELPLTHPELYEDIGIKPPKGVILYGEPGTGKTLLAKAVANSTAATFLRVVGSELIQKYLGDGPKLVRELFRVADEMAPTIVFIDEIDAIGTKRYESQSGGEREIQRTMLELLNQMDGFDSMGDVKVIMATNRIDSLDPALIRPGRIDRKIEFPLPDTKTKRRIFGIHTSKMTLADDVNLEEFVMAKDELSGADIKAVCTESGLLALRERRMQVKHEDFKKAKEKVLYKKKEGVPEGLYM
ncbi:hypothetical protein WJX72_009792 [[Myrmecia] bisecta]|uniref:AAA+ ATPase domain-containing protein n=1 Tax=[Myrmecia] bisecta TaxID=41462 RepID=A0AAW1Q5F7_9CHLO